MTYIEVNHISKKFGSQTVLNQISFKIKKGECFGLIGPNGAGKSTLTDIMTGLAKADEGDIIIDGISIKEDIIKIREKLGVVPQDLALIEELNARDNLTYFGGMYGLSGSRLKERIATVLKATGLLDKQKNKVKSFSGGMKRRLNVAAALLHEPDFLILDEPTVGVDPQSRQSIFDFLRELNQSGTTILYISHYMEEIEALCDRLFLLDLGHEVAYGSQAEVKALVSRSQRVQLVLDRIPSDFSTVLKQSQNGIEEVSLQMNQINLLVDTTIFSMMKLIALIEESDSIIKSVSVEGVSLEETFLQLTGKSLRD